MTSRTCGCSSAAVAFANRLSREPLVFVLCACFQLNDLTVGHRVSNCDPSSHHAVCDCMEQLRAKVPARSPSQSARRPCEVTLRLSHLRRNEVHTNLSLLDGLRHGCYFLRLRFDDTIVVTAPPGPASNRWADIRSLDCFQGSCPESPPAVRNDRLGSNLQAGKTAHSTCLLRNTFQRH